MLRLLTVAALFASTGVATHCPSNIPVWTGQISQIFNGATSPYAWTISPTGTTSTAPQGSQPCSIPSYISQYSVYGGCEDAANQQTAAPQVIMNACKYSFSDGQTRSMTLTLSCDSSATTMSLTPTVPVTLNNGVYSYAFSGKFAGVCGYVSTTTTTATTLASSTAAPTFEAFVLCQQDATVAGISETVAAKYQGRVASVVFNADQTFTAYVYFNTESSLNTFIDAVNRHQVSGATTAGVVTVAPEPSEDGFKIGFIVGLAIGGAVFAVFAVGVIIYCRCRNPKQTNASEYGIPLYPTKEAVTA